MFPLEEARHLNDSWFVLKIFALSSDSLAKDTGHGVIFVRVFENRHDFVQIREKLDCEALGVRLRVFPFNSDCCGHELAQV